MPPTFNQVINASSFHTVYIIHFYTHCHCVSLKNYPFLTSKKLVIMINITRKYLKIFIFLFSLLLCIKHNQIQFPAKNNKQIMCGWRKLSYTFRETSVAKALLQTSQINETCSSPPESLHYTRQILL